MHYYQFNIGDYIKQTVHLSPMEDICYRRLLDMYYETELPIPTETDRVSRRLRLGNELVNLVLQEFFTLTENGWINARCDAEIAAYHTKLDTARSNGKLGGRPKKTQSVILANPAETGSKAKQEPINNKQYIKPSSPDKPDDGFADFWKAYPRKVGKGAALKAWGKVKSKAETLQAILNALAWQRTCDQWTKNGGQFIPHPSTWLNEQRWLDEAPATVLTTAPSMTPEAYEAKRKADAAAAKERMRQEHADFLRAQA